MNKEEFKHDPKAEEWVDPYPKKKSSVMRWLTTFVLLFTLYFLGAGPAVLLAKNQILTWTTVSRVYKPLNTLADNWQPFEKFLDWYIDFWAPRKKIADPPITVRTKADSTHP